MTRNGIKAKYDRLYSCGVMYLAKGEIQLAEKYLEEAAIQLKEYVLTLRDEEKMETREWLLELCGHIREIQKHRAEIKGGTEAGAEGGEPSFVICKSDIPNVSFSDVVGLEQVKERIYDMIIYPRQFKELYQRFQKKQGGGILLYGPPGNGKTMIAKAIAHETGSAFFPIKFSDLGSKWFGETEGKIKSLFDEARKEESAVIFFDEIDAVASKRSESSVMDRVVAELLTQIDGINRAGGNLTVLAATNRPQNLDPAILRPGRFDEKIYVPLPDEKARRQMFEKRLNDVPSGDLSLEEISLRCDGFSGAEIDLVCEKAKQSVIRSIIFGAEETSLITDREIFEAIAFVRASKSTSDYSACAVG